ncbi:uncharacterized protein LOC6526150 [Drosophila yakuba]|uniref:Reticulon-like protein n=1 Tax=Drosophila yakuba TaxID=7245 RepID=B4PZ11_DROYA|nr:uncharacterized protein LOC6526150 [Drosophila yakuba]EDX03072.1 uncharacterized protein Dyak_GE17912 [Drosophila yakuba]
MAKIEPTNDILGNEQQVEPRAIVPSDIVNSPDVVEYMTAARPQRYTFHEVYQMMKGLTWPRMLFDLLSCHELGSISLGLGIIILDVLQTLLGFNLLQKLATFGMAIQVYTCIRPYIEPYEPLINADINVHLTPETVVRVVDCINRWLATMQFVVFGTELLDLFLIIVALASVFSILCSIDIFLLTRIALCMSFAIPRLLTLFENENPMARDYFQFKAKERVLDVLAKLEEMGVKVKLITTERWRREVEAMKELYGEYASAIPGPVL